MKIFTTTTDAGSGFWGSSYEIRLVTVTKEYVSRKSDKKIDVNRFDIHFRTSEDQIWDERWFSSKKLRSDFLEKHFSNILLESIQQPALPGEYVPARVLGESLASVVFVMDYLQLDFGLYGFNIYNWPVIYKAGRSISVKDIDYRNELCLLIGQKVCEVDEYLDLGITLGFENGVVVSVPLKVEEGYSCPEIAALQRDNITWIWTVGQEPFV
jgi:hypothetical protein